jgi:hypothetical protein
MPNKKYRAPEIQVNILGVDFQAFISPDDTRPVFSQMGVCRALKIPQTSVRDILKSKDFKRLQGKSFPTARLLTTVNSRPINVVTQSDLVLLVRIASESGYPVAKSMQDASFAVLLQESVDKALGVERPRQEYLDQGASLRQKLEYLHTYQSLKDATFTNGHGVRGLCKINAQVSDLAVPDAGERRKLSPAWRSKYCSKDETMKLTIGNSIHEKAASASKGGKALEENMGLAARRVTEIYKILDEPF